MCSRLFFLNVLFLVTNVLAAPRSHDEVLMREIPRFRVEGTLGSVLNQLVEETISKSSSIPHLTVIYLPPKDKKGYDPEKVLKFDFERLRVLDIIKMICLKENLRFRIDKRAVFISHPDRKKEFKRTRIYSLSLSEFKHFSEANFKEYLESHGAVFGEDSQLFFIKRVNKLVVTNTIFELDKIKKILVRAEVNEKLAGLEKKIASMKSLDLQNAEKINKELRLIKSLLTEHEVHIPLDSSLDDKLSIIIPKVRFEDRSLDFLVDFLNRVCRGLHENGEGINFLVNVPADKAKGHINLDLDDIELSTVLIQSLKQLDLSFKVVDRVIVICEKSKSYTTNAYDVPAKFTEVILQDFDVNCQLLLEKLGMEFPTGTEAKISIEKNRVLLTHDIFTHQKLQEIIKSFGADK